MKAVAVDIDGTITDTARKLCPEALKAIRMLESRGIPGYSPQGTSSAMQGGLSTIGTSGGIVAENGGVIYADED